MIGHKVGSYVVEAELARGGMGVVYRARHRMLGRACAIKILLPEYSSNPEVVQRFFNEAKAASSIRHLGIVEIYDFGMMKSGVAFIAMELLTGMSLTTRMSGPRIGLRSSLGLVRQICGALGAAHDLGIVHRDLKPDNVFLIRDAEVRGGERIKLLDFGIAKLSQEPGEVANQTRTGTLIGSPRYMSPEQCRGVRVDHRADLYSIGCILYEMLTGRPPFSGEGSGDVLAAHIWATPEPIEHLAPATPGAVVQLVGRLLAKSPAERPQTTRQIIDEIDRLEGIDDVGGSPLDASAVGVDDGVATLDVAPPAPAGAPTVVGSPGWRTGGELPPSKDAAGPRTTLSGAVASAQTSHAVRRRRGILVGLGAALTAGALALAVVTRTVHDGGRAVQRGANAPVPIDAALTSEGMGLDAPDGSGAPVAVVAAPAAASSTIQVRIDSEPPGAHVWLDDIDLGVTPYTGSIPKAAREVVFALRRERFQDYAVQATADADIHRAVRLVPRAPDGSRHPGPRKGTGAAPAAPAARPPSSPQHTSLDDDVTPNPLGAH